MFDSVMTVSRAKFTRAGLRSVALAYRSATGRIRNVGAHTADCCRVVLSEYDDDEDDDDAMAVPLVVAVFTAT